jgi:MFS family permease
MNAVAIFGFVAMIPFLKHEFGAGDQTVGLAFGCFSLGSVAGSLLAGMVPGSILGGVIADQWGTRAVMGISGLAFLLLALNLMGSRALLSERR